MGKPCIMGLQRLMKSILDQLGKPLPAVLQSLLAVLVMNVGALSASSLEDAIEKTMSEDRRSYDHWRRTNL